MIPVISHAQARALLESAADQPLRAEERESLDGHLSACHKCRLYEEELANVQQSLQSSLQSRWSLAIAPLSIEEILQAAKVVEKSQPPLKVFSRLALAPSMIIVLLAITLSFGLSQISGIGTNPTQTLTSTAMLAPTPSLQILSTQLMMAKCESIPYEVQENETLTHIAQQFSISKEIIMAYNGLTTDALPAHAQLRIPLCHSTPLAGSQTPASTLTITPQAEYTLRTP